MEVSLRLTGTYIGSTGEIRILFGLEALVCSKARRCGREFELDTMQSQVHNPSMIISGFATWLRQNFPVPIAARNKLGRFNQKISAKLDTVIVPARSSHSQQCGQSLVRAPSTTGNGDVGMSPPPLCMSLWLSPSSLATSATSKRQRTARKCSCLYKR